MVNETKMKQTEIGLIPEDWELINLGDSFNFKNGLNKEKEFFGYGFPIVNYMDVYKNTFITTENFKGKVFVSKQELRNFEVTLGDVLFTRTSETQEEIGYSAVIIDDLKDTVFSGFVLRARPFNNKFNLEFCRFCFSNRQVREQVISNATYTTRALTNGRVLSKIKIPLPPLAEQEAIATALSNCDSWIDNIDEVLAKKRLIKQGAMQELLTPKEDWDEIDFKDGAWFQEGPGLRNWQFTKSGMKVINVTNLMNGYLNLSRTDRHISLNEYQKMYQHFAIDEMDIVVASSGNSYGKVSVVRKQDLPLLMNTSVIRFKPKDKVEYKYLLIFLKSKFFKEQIDALITGGAQPNFGPAHLNKIKIWLPKESEEQTRIATILSDMDLEIEALEEKLHKARQIKQGMMQELLTGRVRLV